jgi:hypothetical protein
MFHVFFFFYKIRKQEGRTGSAGVFDTSGKGEIAGKGVVG